MNDVRAKQVSEPLTVVPRQIVRLLTTEPEVAEWFRDLKRYVREDLATAWDQGFKQGGPMHDVNYDDPDAHTRNPYRGGTR